MIWQEDEDVTRPLVSDAIIDAVFELRGKTLPNIYEDAFFSALRVQLPWLDTQTETGVIVYFSAEEGNGWFRDDNPEGVIYLSRRTRMVLRLPLAQLDAVANLTGRALTIGEHTLHIGPMKTRALAKSETLYARHVVSDTDDEALFEQKVLRAAGDLGIQCRKLVCGRQRTIITQQGTLNTRSVMLADLKPEQSILLQERGLGTHRHLGCGILIPHKGIK
ncbi:MAG: type I-MYXAN CRISPR-associated protein Cas6/Cmx6 [Gammaproteobacteria bacterium]|nr:type I-MYXAN CRISPR-associated protein Cas6/Cmx6 [Gammaproteobacteria bacterium]